MIAVSKEYEVWVIMLCTNRWWKNISRKCSLKKLVTASSDWNFSLYLNSLELNREGKLNYDPKKKESKCHISLYLCVHWGLFVCFLNAKQIDVKNRVQ